MPIRKTPYLYKSADNIGPSNESAKFGIGAPANQEVAGEIQLQLK